MRWPTRNTLGVVIVAVATALCPSCRTKQTTVETRDFSQNLRSSAAHQRLTLDDTMSFFRFSITDSDTVPVPVAKVIRHARASRTTQETDTAVAVSRKKVQTNTSNHIQGETPGLLSEKTYLLIKVMFALVIISYLSRKL